MFLFTYLQNSEKIRVYLVDTQY